MRLQRYRGTDTAIPCRYVSIWRVSVYRRVARAEPHKAGFGPVLCVSTFRKMCVCNTKSCAFGSGFAKRASWQGAPAARSPLHPLRLYGASRSLIRPDNGSDRISAIHAPSGSLRRSPTGIRAYAFPHRQGACLPPLNPAASSGANPHADWMCATVSPVEPTKGAFRRPSGHPATNRPPIGCRHVAP